jgi:hypothetical protein
VSDSLDHARNALGRDQPAEALVHLWSALDAARADENPRDLADVERLAERIAAKGDESERTEADRLLLEIDRTRGEEAEEDVAIQMDSFDPASPPDETTIEPEEYEPAPRAKGARLWRLIPFAVFLFFIIRDVLR